MPKIIATSNFDLESVAEWIVAENVNEPYVSELCAFMNEKHGGDNATYFFVVKDNTYKLWRGMEDLI